MLLDKVTPVDEHIAKKLRQFRLAAGLSQEKLGELTGVTFQQIQKYEKAKNRVSASKLFEFAQLLERPIGDFYSGLKADRDYYNYEFKTDKKQKKETLELTKEILPLVRAFNRIDNAQSRKHLVALAISICRKEPKRVKHCYS